MSESRNRIPTLPDGIAAQHGHLFQSIKQLRHVHDAGAGWDEIAHMLDTLVVQVEEHFALEEAELERANYPQLENHRGQHAAFLDKLRRLRAECELKRTQLLPVLMELLEKWFSNHELTLDRHAEEFLAAAQ